MTEINEETRVELVRRAIMTQAGWVALAQSIGKDPDRRAWCIEVLKQIGANSKAEFDYNGSTINLSEFLVKQLDNYLSQLGE